METKQAGQSIAKKMLAIMEAIERIEKDSYNEHFKYRFVSEDAVLSTIRTKLIEQKMLCLPSQRSCAFSDGLTTLETSFKLVDTESMEAIEANWFGQGKDTQDKGVYKAATGSEKYFLLKTFMISTADDPERESKGRTAGGKLVSQKQANYLLSIAKDRKVAPDRLLAKIRENFPEAKTVADLPAEAFDAAKGWLEKQTPPAATATAAAPVAKDIVEAETVEIINGVLKMPRATVLAYLEEQNFPTNEAAADALRNLRQIKAEKARQVLADAYKRKTGKAA